MATYYIVNANGYSPVLEDQSFLWTPPTATDAEAYVVGTDAFTAVSDAFAGTKDIYVFSGTYASKNLTLASGRILNLSSDIFTVSKVDETYTATTTPGGTNSFSVKNFTNNGGTVNVGSGVAFNYGEEVATVTNTNGTFNIATGATVKASFTGDGTVNISGTFDNNTNITNAENSANTFVFNGTTTLNGSTISAKAMTVIANVYVNGATVSSTDATIKAYIYVQGTSTLDLIANDDSTKTISFDNGAELKSSTIKNVALKVRSSNTAPVTIFGDNSEIDTILLQGKDLNIGKEAKDNDVAPVTVLKSKQITTGGGKLTIQNATVQNQDNADLSIVSTGEFGISNSTVSAAITATTGSIEIADSNVSGSLRVSQTAASNKLSGDNTLHVALTGKMAFENGASLTDSIVTGGELRNESDSNITYYNGSNEIERTVVKKTLVLDKSDAKEAFLKGDVAGANGTIQINEGAVTLSNVAGKQAAQVIQGSVAPTRITNNVSSYYYIDSTDTAKGLYVTLEDDNTLFIKEGYVAANNSAITTDGHIVGYNAFGSLADLTYEGPKDGTFVTTEGVTVVTAPTISLAAGTVAAYAQPAFFFANNNGVTFVGKDGTAAAKTAVTISQAGNAGDAPLYLMGAVTVANEAGYWAAMQAASGTDYAGAQKFTIDESLALTVADLRVGLPLNYDDFDDTDTKAPKRQAAVGNLTINGKVTTATWLVAGPLSKISVGATGSVVSENRTILNAGSALEVTGEKTAYQFTGGDLQFINGSSTAKFTNSKVKLAKTDGVFMLDGWTKNKEYADVNVKPVEVTFDGTILDITGSNKFFNYNVTADVDNDITKLPALNLTFKNGSVATATGADLNVGAKVGSKTKTDVTVNIGLAEGDSGSNTLTVDSITNYGTINVYSGSTISTGATANTKNITTTGSINLYGATGEDKEATLKAYWTYVTDGSFYAEYADITSRIQNKASVTIKNSTISSNNITNVRGTFTVTDSTVDATKLTVTDGTFSVGGKSKLTIGTLTGVLTLADGAKFSDSSITDGSNGSLLIDTDSEVTFYGATPLTATTDITNKGNLVVDTQAADEQNDIAAEAGFLTAGKITNTDATITVNAGSKISATRITGGTIELVGTPVTGDIVVTTEATGLASAFEWKYGEGEGQSITFTADEKDVSKQHGQYWFTKTAKSISVSAIDTDASTLVVDKNFPKAGPVEFHEKKYMIGYNAFGSLADITFEGPKNGTFVSDDKLVTANSITFAAGEAAEYNQPAFLFGNNANGITFYGENGTAATVVTISQEGNAGDAPLYLMGAVTVANEEGYWGAMKAASGTDYAGAQKFTIAQGLDLRVADLRVGLPLNNNDFKTDKTPKRQAGVGNLTINGTVRTATWLVAGPLSKISVGATGSVVSGNRTILNAGSTLDVLGSADVKAAEGDQFTGGDLQFINGSSTAKFTNSKVKLAKAAGVFMLDGWTKNKEYADVNEPVEVTFDGTILNITDSNKFFNYNVTADVDNDITKLPALNLTFKNSSAVTATGADLNVGAKVDSGTKTDVTVNVLSNSSLSVKSVSNYGTVNVGNAADNGIDPTTGTLTATGAITNNAGGKIYAFGASTINASEIANSGTVTITGTAGKKDAIVNAVIKNEAGGTVSLTNAVVSKLQNAYNRGSVIADNANVTFYKLENDSYGSVFQATDSNIATYSETSGDITNTGTFTVTRGSITAKHDLVNNAPGSWGETKFEATGTTISAQTLNNKGPFSAVNSKITASTAIMNSGTFGFNKGAEASDTKNVIETNSINNSGTFEAANAAITGTTIGDNIPTLANTGIFVLDNSSLTMDSVEAGAGTEANKFTVGGASKLQIGYYVDDDNNPETSEVLVGGLEGKITVLNGANLSGTTIYKADDAASVEFAAAESGATSGITLADGTVIKADIVNNNANLTVNGTVTTDAIKNGTKVNKITTAGSITVNGALTAGDITNTYGTITIDATDSISAKSIAGGSIILDTTKLAALTIDTDNDGVADKAPAKIELISGLSSNMSAKVYANAVAEANLIKSGDIITLGSGASAQQYRVSGGSGSKAMTLYSVDGQDQDKLYVKSTYNDTEAAAEGLVFGYNAFANLATALNIAKDVKVEAGKKVEVLLGGTKDTSITNQTDNLFFGKEFASDTVIKLGQKKGVAPTARTATIGFKAGENGLYLNPAAGKDITIDSDVTIKTTAANDNVMCGTVYLNDKATTGTVTVNGNIVSASDIYFLGAATVTGKLTVDDEVGQLLLRAGKANVAAADGADQVNKAVTIRRATGNTIAESQVNGKRIVLVSGDAVFSNTVITIGALGYDNDKTDATAHEYDVVPSLTSTNTVWTIGQLELANEIQDPSDATFTFNAGSVGVTNDAELGSFIRMNLNGADLTIGGALTNAGIIGTTDTAATATIKANSIANGSAEVTTASITAGAVTAATDITNFGSITAKDITATAGSITNDGSITATGSVTATGITNNGTFTADGASVTGAITNKGTFTADGATVTGTITNTNALTFEGEEKSTVTAIAANAGTVTIDANVEVTLASTTDAGFAASTGSLVDIKEGASLKANILRNTGATIQAKNATIDAQIRNSGGTINLEHTTLLNNEIRMLNDSAVLNAIDTELDGITIKNTAGTFTVKESDEKLNVTVEGNAIKLDKVQLTDANVVGGATVVGDSTSTLNGGAFTTLSIADGSKLDVIDGKLTAGTVAATGTLTLKNSAAIDVTTSIDNLVLDGGVYTTADVTVDETTIPANLKIASLTGTIKLAGTTLNNVTLTSGTFDVAKVLDGEKTVATSFTGINSIGKLVVDEGAALTISAAATVADDSKVSLTVNGDFYNAGTITIDATNFEWGSSQKFVKVAAITGENITNIGTVSVIGVDDTKYKTMAIVKNDEQGKGIYLYKVDAVVDTTTLYVNKGWAGSYYTGDSVEYVYDGGTVQCVFGVNAFADTADLVKYEDTKAIMVKNASNYGAFSWDKAVNVTLNNGEPTFGAVTFGLVNDPSDDDTQTTIDGGFTATSLSFGNDALITGSVTTTGTASFEEEAFIDGNLNATGNVKFEDEAEITGNVISNALIFEEDVKVGGNIAATGAVTLGEDTEVGGVFSADSLTLKTETVGEKVVTLGTLAMAWKYEQVATVAVNGAITAGADSITIDVFDGGLEKVEANKTVISAGSAVDYASIVKNYDASYFTITNDGKNLVLDAKKIAKVKKNVDQDVDKGIYNRISEAVSNVNTGLILIVDGDFGNASLSGKQTRVLTSGTVGNPDPTKASYLVGGWNVANLPLATTSPFYEIYDDYKEFKGNTNVTIENGVFNNAYVIGAELVQLSSKNNEKSVTFYHRGDSNLTITGGKFTAPVEDGKYGERAIAGGLMYNVAKSGVGEAKLIGNVNLTISGGTFEGYDVYGGNYANGNKIYCSNASIKGNITLTLDCSGENGLNFAANAGGYGGIVQASSFGEGRVQGNTEVILTGSNGIKFEQLVGGSTSDIHVITGQDAEGNDIWELQDSFVTGTRTLTFSGFSGDLEFTKIQDFNVVSFEGENTVNFAEGTEGEFHRYFNKDVTTWAFAADADISGNFEFDFSGDTVDLTSFTAASVGEGWTLEHVTSMTDATVKFALGSGLTYDYNADTQKFTVLA